MDATTDATMDSWSTCPADYFPYRFWADLWTYLWTIHPRVGKSLLLLGNTHFPVDGSHA